MALIHLLPEELSNQIAAGEVVEGPSSVVKELVENSIDAGASRITVELSNQLRDIRIADDGSGMSPEDLKLAFKRHATSKISSITDLYSLITNGFRGEALASIASVSKLTCITKRAEDAQASKLYIESGLEELSSAGASTGTSIQVSDLFFNTPVRMKFLKSSNRERNDIVDLVRAFALARPEIAFTLKIDNKVLLETKPYMMSSPVQAPSLRAQRSNPVVDRHAADAARDDKSSHCEAQSAEAIHDGKLTLIDIFGKELETQLLPIELERGDINISGYITDTSYQRSDRRGIYTLLNNRVIRCPVLRSAIDAVYKQHLASGKYPIVLLKVEMPAEDIDVNVHPNKREVKYKNSNAVYTAVGDAIAKALAQAVFASVGTRQISLQDASLQGMADVSLRGTGDTSLRGTECRSNPHAPAQGILRFAQDDALQESGHCEEGEAINNSQWIASPSARNDRFNPVQAPQDFDHYVEPSTTTASSRKFISRLGAIDISEIEDDKRKTSISSQGNKTSFEIVSSDGARAVICRGDFVGENWLKDKYLAFVQELATEILEREPAIRASTARSRPARNPSKSVLKQLWARDHYTCVYCGKILLDPEIASAAKARSQDHKAFRSYLNAKGEMVTVNIFDEHAATYDHLLPASQFTELNLELDNLLTSCPACNKRKSDSLATNTWTSAAKRSNAWAEITADNPLQLADCNFSSAVDCL